MVQPVHTAPRFHAERDHRHARIGTRVGADAGGAGAGATAGLLREVIVADAGSRDATAEVADIAGCRFMTIERAARRAAEGGGAEDACAVAVVPARRLRAGAGLDAAVERFMQAAECATSTRAAVFRPRGGAD